jgi:hypothetical protein
MDDVYSINPNSTGEGWCVRYEHAHGPIEIKCFKHLSAAIRYGKWIARTSPSGILTVTTSSGDSESMSLRSGEGSQP